MILFEPITDRRAASGQVVWFGMWLAITAFAIGLHPSDSGHGTHEQLGLPPCPSVLLFDRPCPGCGLTTSWTAFVHGDWALAFHAHPLGPTLYMLFTVLAITGFIAYLRGQRVDFSAPWIGKATTVGILFFVAFGLVRMAVSPRFGTDGERAVAHALTPKL
jgi:hypothetical protein